MPNKSSAYHLMISVSDGARSKVFYNNLFSKLGWETIYEDDESAGYSDGNFTLWIVPVEKGKTLNYSLRSVGYHHFAIRVDERVKVDEMHEWCQENEVTIVDPPKEYPEYDENYYAVFFLDPDGMKLEVVSL